MKKQNNLIEGEELEKSLALAGKIISDTLNTYYCKKLAEDILSKDNEDIYKNYNSLKHRKEDKRINDDKYYKTLNTSTFVLYGSDYRESVYIDRIIYLNSYISFLESKLYKIDEIYKGDR